MRVLLHVHDAEVEQQIVATLAEAEMDVEPVADVQALCSGLFRDPDAFGLVCIGEGRPDAVCREFREADVKNLLMILLGGWLANRQAMCASLLAGADDVQTLPIDGRELVARIQALHRRGAYRDHQLIRMPGCVFDARTGNAYGEGKETAHLSRLEGVILSTLAMRAGDILSTWDLMNAVYGDGGEGEPEAKIITVMICKIRKKLFRLNGGRDVLRTIWGRGFIFEPSGFVPNFADRRMRSPR